MSGEVIHRPPAQHICQPGWEWRDADGEMVRMFGPHRYGVPPRLSEFPKGTTWLCDDCGQVWVSEGHTTAGWLVPTFRRERWMERLRRLR